MEKPANLGKRDESKSARGFKKLVRGFFTPKSKSKTNTSSSTTEANRTKAGGKLQSHSAGTDTGMDISSRTCNASTGLGKNSTSAVDLSITPAPRHTGPSHDAAATASGSESDIPESDPPVVPSTPDTTEVTNAVGNAPHTDNPRSTTSGLSAAPGTLPLGNTSPGVAAIVSDEAGPASDTVPGSDKPIPEAVGNPSIPQIALAKTASDPVTAPGVNQASTDGRTAQACLWLQAKHAPIWNKALRTLKEKNPDMHKELEETKNSLLESRERNTDEFFRLDTAKPQEKAVVQRWKRYLPSLVAVRGIAMTAAALDPHKIAPIVCACVFFSIDLALNNLSPEDKQKMRNILFETVIAINEWMSFESNFQKKSHDAIQNQVKELEGLLSDYYLEALRLLCDILLSRNGSWRKRLGDKVTNKIVEYDSRLSEFKERKSTWASKKKLIEERLAGEEDIAKVLKWIQQDGDPEKSLGEIENRVTSERRYPNCAEWILRGQEFQDWSRHWFPEKTQRPSKRVIWVNGPYGTGKTTIIYRIVSELQALSENYLRRKPSEAPADEGQSDRPLRVISYFCTARNDERNDESERADYYSTIIRAFARKISLMPDFTLAQSASKFHSTHTRGLQNPIYIKLWEEFLHNLLKDDGGASDFVFVIDALDECDPLEEPVDSEKLLKLMHGLMQEFTNIQILCSSRQHVPVKKYFSDEVLYPIEARSAPKDEIKDFIRDEIESRKNKQPESVFFKAGCEDIRERLKQSLIDHAEGMYEWVNIWLKLTIPIHNTRDTVRLPEDAEEMLKAIEDSSRETNGAYEKLKDGYLRLWKLGALRGFDELRICLFRLFLCSFKPLSVEDLTCLLQNRIGSLSVSETEILYSNFLFSDVGKDLRFTLVSDVDKDLRFTHNSAREFVVREILGTISGGPQESLSSLVMKESHRSVAKLFVDFIQRSDKRDAPQVLKPFELSYFRQFGLLHCKYAAEKQSIFDNVWSDIIQRVLLPVKSRSASDIVFTALAHRTVSRNVSQLESRRLIFSDREGKSYLLFSHALICLRIIHDDDASDPRLENLSTASSDTSTPEGMLRHFVEQAPMESTYANANANALHVACLLHDAAAVNLVLKSTYYLCGKNACTALLSQQIRTASGKMMTPFALTANDDYRPLGWGWLGPDPVDRFTVMETLLLFESRYLNTPGDKENGHSSQASHKAQQWSDTIEGSDTIDEYQNALEFAVMNFEEETLCRLLKIAEPIAVNEPDKSGYTPLMMAAHKDRLKIMRVLVEDCHADLNVKGLGGETVLGIARKGNQEAADYLEMRMGISEPGQSVDLSSEVDEDSS